MKDRDEMTFDIDEDEGLDLNKPKVAIIEDEEETPEQKEKRKTNVKKIKKYGLILSCSVIVIGVVLFFILRPKDEERVLPFSVESGTNTYTANGNINSDSFIVKYYDEYSDYCALAYNLCNMKDKPADVGGNTVITVEQGESVKVIGDVCDKEGNFLDWYYCLYKGKFGYLSTENAELYNRREGVLTLNVEPETIVETEVVEDLTDEEKEIKEKAFIKELENIEYKVNKYSKYEIEGYCIRRTYDTILDQGEIEWLTQREVDENGNVVLETTENEQFNIIIGILYNFERLNNEYINTTDKEEDERIEKEIQEVFTLYNNTFGPFLTQEAYAILRIEELQLVDEEGMIIDTTLTITGEEINE